VATKPPADAEAKSPAPRFPRWRVALIVLVIVVAAGSPFWGPRLLRQFAFFRVRKVEVLGARYTPLADVLSKLAIDTSRSVWDPTDPLAQRVLQHPQVKGVEISRKLPGTLVIQLTERRPVAFVSTTDRLEAVDESGRVLPLDPSVTPVDLPLVATTPRDTGVYHLLGAMQRQAPAMYAQLTSVTRLGRDELAFRISDVLVRSMTSVTLARLGDIEPVLRDLAQRQLHPAELDLRYRDQVIARLP
jgi:cell division protein FtsQ